MKTHLTQAELRDAISYDKKSGEFTWVRKPNKRIKEQSTAGCLVAEGYRVIRVNGRLYKAHRLAWLYVHGEWPSGCLDHINGCKSDNRIENLRCVSHGQNMENQLKAHSNSATGVLGVNLHEEKYVARIRVRGKRIHLGRFSSLDEASAAYLQAKRKLHSACTL